ncbi:MAG: CDGSH iron-sulfur domain-containing protein, partial [Bacteroidales bacterium]
ETGKIYEPKFEPAIGIIEDSQIAISGPIWVKGGIRIESSNGRSYEIRNRVVICRCGCSSNKPFCDGTHATAEYYDGLGFEVGNP